MMTDNPFHVVIIGGVAGGMSSATRLRRLNENCRITVIEKDSYISSATCGLPYALGRVIESEASLHVQTTDKIKSWFNIDVIINTEAVDIDKEKKQVTIRTVDSKGIPVDGTSKTLPYDKLIIATGAEAVYPRIEGIGSEHVFPLRTIADLNQIQQYRWTHSIQDVAIIGGGFIGLEAAENLVKLGLDVILFEFLPQVMPSIDASIAEYLHTELRRHGVKLILNARIVKIDRPKSPEQALIHLENGATYPADAIIMAAGIRGRTELAEKAGLSVSRSGITVKDTMQTSDPDIYAVGDVVATTHRIIGDLRNLALGGPANRQGRLAADHISGRPVHYSGHVGTFVCKVFGLTVASVGLTVAQLTELGRDFEYVTVHPPDHASYYPGACPITLVVEFDRSSGKILGAQAVGKKGVEKRIDVIATAIRAGMMIKDLQDLELSYAPPYGSAKDPINMAGYVGTNVMNGDVKIVHTADLQDLSKYQIVDVRSPKEFCRGHLQQAVNIPLDELRQRYKEVDKSKTILVYCQVGYRGYLAYRVLKQKGFDVFNIDGGYKIISEGGFKHLTTGS